MKTITKEINLLDIEDIEEALSIHVGKKIVISDVACSLVYCVPADTNEPSGMYLEFVVDDSLDYYENPSSFDIFQNEEGNCHYWKGKQLALDEPSLPIDQIFNFDVSAFKSFDSWTDSSD